jgi:hypothetical protein
VSREGPKGLGERLFNDREAELQARVDRRRITVITCAPGALGAALAAYDAFAGSLASLDIADSESLLELDTECEPVPLEAEGT